MENQGMSDPSGPYQVTSSVPYLEEGEELTCRAETRWAEPRGRTPPRNSLVVILVVCGLVSVLLVSAGGVIAYRRYRGEAQSWFISYYYYNKHINVGLIDEV